MSNMIVFELSIIKKLQSLLFNFLLWYFQNILTAYIFLKFWTFRFVCLFKCSSAFSGKSAAKYPHRVLTFFFLFFLSWFFFLSLKDRLLYFDSFVGTISVGSSNLLNPSVTVKVKNQKNFEKKKKKTFNHLFLLTKFYSLTLKPLLFL